jgi:hypothetical protein
MRHVLQTDDGHVPTAPDELSDDNPRVVAAADWLRGDDTAYEQETDAASRAAKEMLAAADAVDPVRARVAELERTFDLRWHADMRAIKRWQAAAPGRDQTWPDHADLVVWLLEQLESR